jgi:hypothetical protein
VTPVVEVLTVAGLHDPIIELSEMFGRTGTGELRHNGSICVNAGSISGVTPISIVVKSEHCPPSGVKVYVKIPAVAVLIVAGFQLPLIEFSEMPSSKGATEFSHNGPIWVKIGVMEEVISTSIVVITAH